MAEDRENDFEKVDNMENEEKNVEKLNDIEENNNIEVKIDIEEDKDTEEENDIEENNNNEKGKDKRKIIFLIVIIILVATVCIASAAYAKFRAKSEATGASQVANVNCQIEVQACNQNDSTIVNPYCSVTVKNYNQDGELTQANLSYTVEVLPKGEGVVLPQYSWRDSNGTVVATNTALTGTLSYTERIDENYTIVFLNPGDLDVAKDIEFKLVALQVNN